MTLGDLVDTQNGVVNLVNLGEGILPLPSQKLDRAVGDSPGISGIVRGVENAPPFERVPMAGFK